MAKYIFPCPFQDHIANLREDLFNIPQYLISCLDFLALRHTISPTIWNQNKKELMSWQSLRFSKFQIQHWLNALFFFSNRMDCFLFFIFYFLFFKLLFKYNCLHFPERQIYLFASPSSSLTSNSLSTKNQYTLGHFLIGVCINFHILSMNLNAKCLFSSSM